MSRFPSLSKVPVATVGAVLAAVVALLGEACQRGSNAGRRGDAAADAPVDPAAVEVSASRGVHIALLYSSNLQGELESCDCPTQPLGGLARRATVVARAQSEADGVLVVDAGDMLMPPAGRAAAGGSATRPHPLGPAALERRARLLLQSYARMGVAAILPAEGELALGMPVLRRLLKSTGVPAVASNLEDASGNLLFDRDRIVTIAGVPIGIFGVVQPPEAELSRWKREGIRVTDAAEAARAEVASLKARGARMIVALLHLGGAPASRALLQAAPGIT